MAIGYFLTPYDQDSSTLARTPRAVLGISGIVHWRCLEGADGWGICKVSADLTVLATIAALPQVFNIPVGRLDDLLSTLTTTQASAIQTFLNNRGFSNAEILAALPNGVLNSTLMDLLTLFLSRCHVVTWDGTEYVADRTKFAVSTRPEIFEIDMPSDV